MRLARCEWGAGWRISEPTTPLLPVALVRSGAFAHTRWLPDIRTDPAERARRAVEEAQLADRIEVRLGPGLSVLQPEEADDLVIAGMGGGDDCLHSGEAPWIRSSHFRLILQPMSRPEVLRRWLHRAGFLLEAEPAVEDGGHLYSILRAHYEPEAVPAAEEGAPDAERGFSGNGFRGAMQGDTPGRGALICGINKTGCFAAPRGCGRRGTAARYWKPDNWKLSRAHYFDKGKKRRRSAWRWTARC